MAGRLSKADWNKLKKSTESFKGSLQKGVRWTTRRPKKKAVGPLHERVAKALGAKP